MVQKRPDEYLWCREASHLSGRHKVPAMTQGTRARKECHRRPSWVNGSGDVVRFWCEKRLGAPNFTVAKVVPRFPADDKDLVQRAKHLSGQGEYFSVFETAP